MVLFIVLNLIHCQFAGGLDKSVYLWVLLDSFSTLCPVLQGEFQHWCQMWFISLHCRKQTPLVLSFHICSSLQEVSEVSSSENQQNKGQFCLFLHLRVINRSCAEPDLELLFLIKYSQSHTHTHGLTLFVLCALLRSSFSKPIKFIVTQYRFTSNDSIIMIQLKAVLSIYWL